MKRAPICTIRAAISLVAISLAGSFAFAQDPVGDARKKLDGPDPAARAEAVLGLAGIPSDEALAALVSALEHGDPHVRLLAAKALGARADQRALEPLRAFLKKSADITVRLHTLGALARLGDPDAVSGLIALLGENRKNIDTIAADLLAEAGKPAVQGLVEALETGVEQVRPKAAEVLGRIGDKAAAPALLKATGRDASRLAAVRALGAIGDEAAAPRLREIAEKDEGKVTSVAAAYAVLRISGDDPAMFGRIVLGLEHADGGVVTESLEALSALKNPASLDPVLAALERNMETGDLSVRCSIAKALGELGDRRAVKPLIRAFRETYSDFMREYIAQVLNRLTGKKVKCWEDSNNGKAWED